MSVKRNNECRGVVIQFKVNPRLCRGTHRGLTYATVATKYISLPLEGGGRRWGCRVNGVHGPSRLTPIPIPARGARKARAPARRGGGRTEPRRPPPPPRGGGENRPRPRSAGKRSTGPFPVSASPPFKGEGEKIRRLQAAHGVIGAFEALTQ